MNNVYRPFNVTADWLADGVVIPAFTTGATWNGWECPAFAKEAADRVADACSNIRYDEATDAFVVIEEDYDDEETVYPAEMITLESGETVKVYAIGAFGWCWDAADPE